ncbi:uncharacterized protein LOC132754066 [Ruditapes philippinarum]|uniref:uncharacterized protein LOC132754066 n=1 Tax=Ruditapes philippinarum TaxID=129788 RepID=UPI00295A93AD|nr:uncharacterized protein LOC132754066 [Ruditapes philippinarum]XP_060600648.1 uncharacterized protein LOC132754066 [Ruditapes philippinarum]
MAVSGRKQVDLLGSVAAGSEEDFDHCCDPCLTTGQRIKAHGFCGTCQEYLCSTCLDCHKKAKISRNHNILSKDELDKSHTKQQSYNECTELCAAHKKEVIKFYCPSHNELGCNDCMTLGHRTCKIEYIPDKCRGIAEGKEFDNVMQKLSGKLKEAEKISRMAKERSNDINKCNKEIIKAITEFRKVINDRLDQMQQYVSTTAEGIKTKNIKIVQKVLEECASMISDIKSLQSKLNVSKSNQQHSQLFIDIKWAESSLKSNKLNDAENSLINTNMHYSFERNSDLESLLSKTRVFGEIVSHSCYEPPNEMKSVDCLIVKGDINVKTSSDKMTCDITGCAVINTNKLVLADYTNKKVKLVSIDNKLVQKEKALDSKPFDIAVMCQDQFAVTMPNIKEIVVMTTDNKLSCVRSIKVDRSCYGIDYNRDCLYVACLYPSSVIVLNTQGDILNKITLNFLTSEFVPYIAVSKDSRLLFISDRVNNSIVSVSLQGTVTATYKHTDLSGPRGMLMLDDGSLLVCCSVNGTIHKVNGDLKQGNIMCKGVTSAQTICYSAHHDEVYVGCFGTSLKVFGTNDI